MTCISSYTHLITPATRYKYVFWYSGKIRFIEPQGINGHRRPLPGAPSKVHPGRARQCSGTGPCGYCRRVLWLPGPRGQYSGKIRFIEKPGVQDDVAKRSSDPWVAYHEVNVQVRDLVRVVGIVAPFAHGGSVFGENSFYRSDKPKAVYPLSRTFKLEA